MVGGIGIAASVEQDALRCRHFQLKLQRCWVLDVGRGIRLRAWICDIMRVRQ